MSKKTNTKEELQRKVKDLLLSFNFDLRGEMKETPRRVVDLYFDMLEGTTIDPKVFFDRPLPTKHNEMILVKDIEYVSWCCHHLWPFFGKAHIAYVPKNKIVGLSKFISAVRAVTRQPTLQERVTTTLVETIDECLQPQGVMVIVEAQHTCMLVGGKYDYGMPSHTSATTTTSAVRGVFLLFEPPRNEALKLIYGR